MAALCAVVAVAAASGVLAQAASAVTIVSFNVDDGLSSAPEAGSILSAHGIKGSFFILTGEVGTPGFVTWEGIATLASEGHEIGGHAVSNEPDLPKLTPAEQEFEICGSREALEAHGYHPVSYAYPHGDFNAESVRIMKVCGYTSARLFGDYQGPNGPNPAEDEKIYPEPYSIPNPYELSTQGSPETPVTLEELKHDYEWGVGGWVIIAIHSICPSVVLPNQSECAGMYGPTSQTVLEEYLAWIAAQPNTVVRTNGQVVDDKTPPMTTLRCYGTTCGATYASPVTVTLNATDAESAVASTHYTTNGTEPTTSSPAYAGSFQVASTTTVKYRSWDVRGNAETVNSQTVTVDTATPVSTIESKPASLTNSTEASFSFKADEAATFECKLDGGSFKACSSPETFAGLADGAHTFEVRAINLAETKETPAQSYSWTVDTIPPVTTIESQALQSTESGDLSVAFSANETATFECSLDGGTYTRCVSPYVTHGLGAGFHTLLIRATDAAGNLELQPVSYTWTVVAPPPAKGGGGSATPGSAPPPTVKKSASQKEHESPRVVMDSRLGGAVRRRGLPLELYCPRSCDARVVVDLLTGTEKNDRRATRPRVLARTTARAVSARTLKLRVKLRQGSAGRLDEAERRHVRLQVSVTVRLADGGTHRLKASAAIGAQLLAWLQ